MWPICNFLAATIISSQGPTSEPTHFAGWDVLKPAKCIGPHVANLRFSATIIRAQVVRLRINTFCWMGSWPKPYFMKAIKLQTSSAIVKGDNF